MKVAFFGHSDAPEEIKSDLKSLIISLIDNYNANIFYVGNKGNFDSLVIKVLAETAKTYSSIKYRVVLSELPSGTNKDYLNSETVFPAELAAVPKKFAIDRRNMWMVENSDIVVTYVKRTFGGAAKFKSTAEKKGKIVINIV